MIIGLSLAQWQDILSIILVGISIVIGVLNLSLLIKKIFRDGRVTDDEMKELTDELNRIYDNIKQGERKDKDGKQ